MRQLESMRSFKLSSLLKAGLLASGGLLAGGTLADMSKPLDPNGGHWEYSGVYQCHLDGCVPTVSRNQYRSRAFTNPNDQDMYFVKEDWPHWQLVSQCKTARTFVLEQTSKVPVTWTNPRQCEIREGLWVDEYTGDEFTRGAQLEIDHIIPLKYANSSNGYQWDEGKRASFANDPLNLIAVSREVYRKKRERSIGSWQPRDEFQCDYAVAWKQVSEKYDLDLFARDISRMNKILGDCGDIGTTVEED
ncbi:MAG: hypothetical protein RLZZ227_1877 [Pseudomonadota bacterium]|jgi:hypothetical protein